MNSLVGYGSSSSDSEGDEVSQNDNVQDQDEGKASAVNLLEVEPDENNSEDETVDAESYEKARSYLKNKGHANYEKLPNPLAASKLPTPNLETKVKSTLNAADQQSVFVTSYQKNEQAKLSVLEKHVKVTSLPSGDKIHGKKVCWLYRKGQCRKGHRCQFAHDNDLFVEQSQGETDQINTSTDTTKQNTKTHTNKNFQFGAGYFQNQQPTVEPVDEDNYMAAAKRKCRPGMTDHMQPPKKSMTMLAKQRATERPWTVKK